MNRPVAIGLMALALSACTDARTERVFNYGEPGRVTCHTGGIVVFDDYSTGRIEKHSSSDGFYFVSRTSGRLSEVTGDCIIDYGATPQAGWQAVRP